MRAHLAASLATLVLVFYALLAHSEPAGGIALSVSPRVGNAPQDVRIRVTVEPSDDARTLTVMADSGEVSRSSQMPLQGRSAPRTTWVEWRAMPPGTYHVVAFVGSATKVLARGDDQFIVTGFP